MSEHIFLVGVASILVASVALVGCVSGNGMETELLYDLFTWLGDVEYGFFRV